MMDGMDVLYLALCGIVIMLVFATLPSFGNGWLYVAIILAALAGVMILALNWVDFIVFPAAMKMFKITFQPAKDYLIVKGQDAILKNVGGLFYATGFTTGNLFGYTFKAEQEEEAMEEKILLAPENWERAVMSLGFPFKFHVLSVGSDVQKVRDDLEAKRGYQEFQLGRTLENEKASAETAITDIRRKISIIQAKIDRVSAGEKPVTTLMYFETTAVGVSEKAALDSLSTQIKQLQIGMSSLNLQISRVVGRELYALSKFNFAIPLTFDEIANEFSQEG
jgi:hypothetical protein